MQTTYLWLIPLILLAAGAVIGVLLVLLTRRPTPETEAEYRVEYDTPDYTEQAIFKITRYPDHEISNLLRHWLINNSTAELEYNVVPSNDVRLRVAPSDTLLIPSDYTDEEYEMVTNYEIDGIPVTQYQSPGRLGMSTWTKEGFDYAVTAENPEMNLLNGVTYDFVMNTDAESSPDRD